MFAIQLGLAPTPEQDVGIGMVGTNMVIVPNECMAKQGCGEEQALCDKSNAWPTTHRGKIAARRIGDGRCQGCQNSKESIKHIF